VQIVGGAECKAQIYKALHCGHYLTLIDYDACKKRKEKKPKQNRSKVAQLNTPKTPFSLYMANMISLLLNQALTSHP